MYMDYTKDSFKTLFQGHSSTNIKKHTVRKTNH